MAGPLTGVKVIEIAGLGPAPFCGMMLADMGADGVLIGRKRGAAAEIESTDILYRGRRSISLDLKNPAAVDTVLRMTDRADILIEGFRPGVMERLGLGPEVCHARNRKLVYGRITGWGQSGPLAHGGGHDINYIALTGALHAIGSRGSAPIPPLNLVGDFGGGAMMLAFGVVCALLEARTSGNGQVVDAAMTDGASLLMTMIYGLKAGGNWTGARGENVVDGGAHFYGTYQCADGNWVAIGSVEPQFYALLLRKAGINDVAFAAQWDHEQWPALKEKLASVFATKTRAEWCELMEGTDVCFAPVLDMEEAPKHPHNRARQTFVEIDGVMQPAPAPKFSRSKPEIRSGPCVHGGDAPSILADYGFGPDEIEALRVSGAL